MDDQVLVELQTIAMHNEEAVLLLARLESFFMVLLWIIGVIIASAVAFSFWRFVLRPMLNTFLKFPI